MDRRRFLGIVTVATAGLYLPRIGLIELSRKLVLDVSGSCSFCGKHVQEVFGLAGLRQGGAVRICDECISLCLDIIAEESRPPPPPGPLPPNVQQQIEDLKKLSDELQTMIEAEIEEYRVKIGARRDSRNIALACSFCEKPQKEVAKLIAGPTVYICDGCIGDAAGLFGSART